jgi:antitoxin component YwqK of YwqJK toxin-antitoxin module
MVKFIMSGQVFHMMLLLILKRLQYKTNKAEWLPIESYKTYYENGGIFEEVRYEFGTPKYMRVYREDGTIADEKGFFDRKIIERIVG